MKVLFIAPYPPGEAPSQRFRFEQYFTELRIRGIGFHVSPFFDRAVWKILYRPGHLTGKVSGLIRGMARRVGVLFTLWKYDTVFIHREALPFGPPFLEWMIARVFRKFMVYDFDDAIWIPNASESNNRLTMLLKCFGNPARISRWASCVSVGNGFLAGFASRYNDRVFINPTTIDTDEHHNSIAKHSNKTFVIGWTGSHSTIQYLDELVPVLRELEKDHVFEFHVICDVAPKFQLDSLKFIRWTKQAEIEDLLHFNVGLMPLPDDVWSKGKCGFKALQYMALGIPAVVSAIGVNSEIVQDGFNGLICRNPQQWKDALKKLITDQSFLIKLGANTRQTIVDRYSLRSNRENFIRILTKPQQK
ncbi:MAG: glycosyltransferase [Bacteroidia bacterium]|nr:glycosyltransferase [Bacteroidia bacterium]